MLLSTQVFKQVYSIINFKIFMHVYKYIKFLHMSSICHLCFMKKSHFLKSENKITLNKCFN